MTLAEQLRAEGRQEGLQEGLLQERRVWVERILSSRFGPLPQDAAERIASANREPLERWAETVMTAESVDGLLGE